MNVPSAEFSIVYAVNRFYYSTFDYIIYSRARSRLVVFTYGEPAVVEERYPGAVIKHY